MSQRSVIFDPFKFAAEGRQVSGRVAVGDLARLSDVLFDAEGEVSYQVIGDQALDGPSMLRIEAHGVLHLCCQRCLGALSWPVSISPVLQLVRPGAPIPDDELEEDGYDAVEASAEMDVLALVEDELLLALPVAPRHDVCEAPRPLGGDQKKSPFAVLAGLNKRSDVQ